MDLELYMLKIWGLQVKGLQNYQPSNFENDLTPEEPECGPIGSSGAGAQLRTFSWDLQLWQLVPLKQGSTEPLFTVSKDLKLFENHTKN